jgi:hypothetical protein
MNRQIETQMYSLSYIANGPVMQNVNINVPFTVRKLVFKPVSLIIPPGFPSPNQAVVMFSNLYDVNRTIGYSGYFNAVSNGGQPFTSLVNGNQVVNTLIGDVNGNPVYATGTAAGANAIIGTVTIAGFTYNVLSDGFALAIGTVGGYVQSTVSNVVYVQPAHDMIFTLRGAKDINGSFQFYMGNATTGSLLSTAPVTCAVVITVEYHSEV